MTTTPAHSPGATTATDPVFETLAPLGVGPDGRDTVRALLISYRAAQETARFHLEQAIAAHLNIHAFPVSSDRAEQVRLAAAELMRQADITETR